MQSKPKISHLDPETKPAASHSEGKDSSRGHKPANIIALKPLKTPRLSKMDARYWRDRLFRRTGEDYHVQIGFAGHQERFPLRTPNREAAAATARDIYKSLNTSGWDETRERFKPWQNKTEKIEQPTVGEFLDVLEKFGNLRPQTFTVYARKFRRLVAGIKGFRGDENRFDHIGKGCAEWRDKIGAVRLSEITPGSVAKWKQDYTSQNKTNPAKAARAEATAQSILRNSKSLFAGRILRNLQEANVDLHLPEPLPFDGVEIGKAINHRYRSKIDALTLAVDANSELAGDRPEEFKIFLLAFGAGLRRDEIDTLTWHQFNWSKSQILIEATAHGSTKTDSSIAPVDIDPELAKLFAAYHKNSESEFAIESKVKARPGATWHHYRCNRHFRSLNAWLRSKGVNAHNPIHTLRKEFGTLICSQFGIFAASEALRHSDIRLTRAHYADRPAHRIHLAVGKMLKGKK